MKAHGVAFLPNALPIAFERPSAAPAAITVKYSVDNVSSEGEFDTVLIATGRFAPVSRQLRCSYSPPFLRIILPHQIPLN